MIARRENGRRGVFARGEWKEGSRTAHTGLKDLKLHT